MTDYYNCANNSMHAKPNNVTRRIFLVFFRPKLAGMPYACSKNLKYVCFTCRTSSLIPVFFLLFSRKAAIVDVRGVWLPHHRPVHSEGVPRPGVACRVPQVCGLPPVPRRNVYVLRQRRKNIL